MLVIVFYSISLPDSKKLAAMAMLIQLQPCHAHSRNSHIDKEKVEGNKSFLVNAQNRSSSDSPNLLEAITLLQKALAVHGTMW